MTDDQYLEIRAGESLPVSIPVSGVDDLVGITITFKAYQGGQLKLSRACPVVGDPATSNSVRLTLGPTDTLGLSGDYEFEVEATTETDLYVIAEGTLHVDPPVPQEVTGLAAMVPFMSKYRVSDELGSKFTTARFNYLASRAKRVYLDADLPEGVAQETYEHMHLLTILHLFEVSRGGTVMTSEKLGDYSYGKPSGTSAFLQEYEAELEKLLEDEVSEVDPIVDRSDADMPELELDGSEIPNYSRRRR
ncbi:MAG: hypothetical protein LLG45_13345 [Actinomycetia bacterium]|nr:hypothetical protein [Actinomycetes bacterium]